MTKQLTPERLSQLKATAKNLILDINDANELFDEIERLQTTIEQLQQENNELKANVNRQGEYIEMLNTHLYMEYSEEFQFTDLAPKQSLAEHDKQTAIKAIEDMIENTEPYITNKGYQIREVDDILDYISQLKDS